MEIKSISGTTYFVKDLKKTAKFYESLGFRLGKQDDETLTVYVNWFWIKFIAQKDAKLDNKGVGAFLNLKVDSADESHKDAVAHGVKPDGEPQNMPGGSREFIITDPDGYKLIFFEKK